jgi:cell division protein FtsL
MSNAELISIAGLFLAGFTAIAKVWHTHDTRITKIESRADVCDEKHKNTDRINLKQAEINANVSNNHMEVMTTLATIQQQIAHLIEKINENTTKKN